MKIKIASLCLLAVLAVSGAMPSPISRAHAASVTVPVDAPSGSRLALFDAQRFLADMGVGYYAYHHFVYKRYTAGSFKPNATNRLFSLGKAGTALAFAYDRFRRAYQRTTSGHDQQLTKLAPSLNALLRATNTEANKLKNGNYNDADFQSYNKMVESFQRQSKGVGYQIIDIRIGIPGA
jgi:hypothetical protein